jgi:hypothetical protein
MRSSPAAPVRRSLGRTIADTRALRRKRLFSRDCVSSHAFDVTTENRGVPGSSPGVATRNPHSCGIYCLSDRSGVAINGYSIGYLGRVYFELETESPVLINVRAC